jgi:hypothetical protein
VELTKNRLTNDFSAANRISQLVSAGGRRLYLARRLPG